MGTATQDQTKTTGACTGEKTEATGSCGTSAKPEAHRFLQLRRQEADDRLLRFGRQEDRLLQLIFTRRRKRAGPSGPALFFMR